MSENNQETNSDPSEFDFSRFPSDTLFHERRTGQDRRDKKRPTVGPDKPPANEAGPDRRAKKDRRRRIDPTTFDKQYSDDEMEFMNAMQRYKEISGQSFPTYREVLRVLIDLGYRRAIFEPDDPSTDAYLDEPVLMSESTVDV